MATIRHEARYITDLPPDLLTTVLGGVPAPPFVLPALPPQLWFAPYPSAVISQPSLNLTILLPPGPSPPPPPPPAPAPGAGTGDKEQDDWNDWYLYKKRLEEEEMEMLAVTVLVLED